MLNNGNDFILVTIKVLFIEFMSIRINNENRLPMYSIPNIFNLII